MTDQERLVEKFYTCFRQKDWQGMQSCYHADIEFSDPVFSNLKGSEAGYMWRMLVTAGKDLVLTFKPPVTVGDTVRCEWEAFYTFSATGKKVHNMITGTFAFRDGKIVKHTDRFDFYRWSRMALGIPGKLLGWTPWLRAKVQQRAMGNLRKFMAANP